MKKIYISKVNSDSWEIVWNRPDDLLNGIKVSYTVEVIYAEISIWTTIVYHNAVKIFRSVINQFLCLPVSLKISARSSALTGKSVMISEFQFPKGI